VRTFLFVFFLNGLFAFPLPEVAISLHLDDVNGDAFLMALGNLQREL
jgi:hypothetical protein